MFELLKKMGCLSVKYLLFSDVTGQLLNWFLSTMMLKIDRVGLNKQLIVFLQDLILVNVGMLSHLTLFLQHSSTTLIENH